MRTLLEVTDSWTFSGVARELSSLAFMDGSQVRATCDELSTHLVTVGDLTIGTVVRTVIGEECSFFRLLDPPIDLSFTADRHE